MTIIQVSPKSILKADLSFLGLGFSNVDANHDFRPRGEYLQWCAKCQDIPSSVPSHGNEANSHSAF